ncbi:MAG: DNA phosphorothioation system sulfurtransferase DndC [Microcoleus vaginatus WJT46-NPBG5]|jgi:DNA sulfur modification protein DndC|nr:DNA phosphorothioation system sulfurtransferase DndC [Microcoleus vaginatus WJT46-NPBG5]
MTEMQQIPLFPPRNVAELVEDIEKLTEEIQELYCQDDIPFAVGWSGGKDSTAVLQLIWYAIAKIPVEKRTKKIYVLTNDTLVENPIVSAWVRKSLEQMKIAAQEQGMPIEPHLTYPAAKDTFWACLIGKGYPAPRKRFRWCTERLKIKPADSFIRDVIRSNGEVILVLGTRIAESSQRAATMAKHREWRVRDRLNTNPSRPNSLIYLPIEDWRTDEVWIYLNQWPNPWGQNNKDLMTMYRGATADNECPLVVDTTTPSCGDSRFGCWVCTMVNKDKSMEAMIQNDEEKEWMQPLLDIRNELDMEDDRHKRDFRRIYGRVELFERNVEGEISVEPMPGPYTKEWREYWLRRVLEAQTQIRKTGPEEMRDITLITQEELIEIRRIWLEEKHEFDDSLPKIYQEVTGTPFQDTRQGVDKKLLGSDEWTVLTEVCEEDEMHLELMARLLDTERQHFTKPRRTGIYTDLEKCFDTSSRDKEKAIDNAHYQRNIKTAVQAVRESDPESLQQVRQALEQTGSPQKENPVSAGKAKNTVESDSNQPKQLSWADVKFAPTNAGAQDTQD